MTLIIIACVVIILVCRWSVGQGRKLVKSRIIRNFGPTDNIDSMSDRELNYYNDLMDAMGLNK